MSNFWSTLPDAQVAVSYKHSERPIKAVSKIIIKGSTNVYFRSLNTPHLIVSGVTQDVVNRVKTNLVGDKLIIETEPFYFQSSKVTGGIFRRIFNRIFGGISSSNISVSGNGIVITGNNTGNINSQTIYTGNISTGSQVHAVVGIALPEIPIVNIKGGGNITLLDLKQAGIVLEIEASGDITASGEVDSLTVKIAGSGYVDATDLIVNQGNLSIAASGAIRAHVKQSVTAQIAGSGDIVVRGNPVQKSQKIAGSGSVKFK